MATKALIFDFDGLILDTETPELTAWQELYREHGCELPLDLWADCIGRPHGYFDPYGHLIQLSGRTLDRESLRQRRRARTRELIFQNDAMPGVREYVQLAAQLGLKLGVASSSTLDWVNGHLERLNLRSAFMCLTCAECTSTHKPDPAPYLHALNTLNVAPDDAMAFEDSPNGITSARSAGLFCVAVPNPVTRLLDLSHANLQVPSLQSLSLPALLARRDDHTR